MMRAVRRTHDRKEKPVGKGGDFRVSKAAQKRYERQLRRVAKVVGGLVTAYSAGAVVGNTAALSAALAAYAVAL